LSAQAEMCAGSMAIASRAILEAGTSCTAGPELLECDVASNGNNVMPNYCVTSELLCSAVSDPSCQSQCSSAEYGVRCSDFSVPGLQGCRVVWPSSSNGTAGFAFCCGCN
jgi:hypothetical protein